MTANPQTNMPGNQQKTQPDVRATNPGADNQRGQQNQQNQPNKQDAYPQNKPGFDPSKPSARPEDKDDDEKGGDKNNDPYKKPAAERY